MPAHDVEVRGVVVPRGAGLPPILDGADLSVIAGERHALVGPSGSGKTTLARVVLGRLAPARGDVRVGPFRLPVAPADRAAFARSVGWIAQDAAGSLDPTFTALELVAEPCVVHGACGRREAAERARDALARAGLPADAALRRPGELSGGQCQRVAVARALALSPGLVVADEPTSALDPLLQAAVLDLLSSLCAGAGATLLLVAHSPGVVRRWCDRVSLVQGGRVHASFEAASFDPPAGAP